jgi:hypothetical protein
MKTIMAAAIFAMSLQGCASIVSGSTEPLSVETKSSTGDQITGAACKMTNDKGTWFVATPGTVPVHRSLNDLSVLCTKDGFQPASIVTPSTTKGIAFGNILFGGIIGAGVDASTGAAYDYPSLIPVLMTPMPLSVSPTASRE